MKFKKLIKKISVFSLLSITTVAASCSFTENLLTGIGSIAGIFKDKKDDKEPADPGTGNQREITGPQEPKQSDPIEISIIGTPPKKDEEQDPNQGNVQNPPQDINPDNGQTQKETPNQQPKKEIYTNKVQNFLPISEQEVGFIGTLTPQEKEQELKRLNSTLYTSLDQVQVKMRNNEPYLEYVDPEIGLIFRDFSYQANGETKYLLGKEGLLQLVHEFKRKIPYGPEIHDLKSISINDLAIINEKVNGLYMPNSRRMFVNGLNAQEKGFDTYQIIGNLMPTIFHEYMHHWVTVYAETGLIEDPKAQVTEAKSKDINKRQLTEVYYNPGTTQENVDHSHGARQFWNSYFTANFYSLLNYDVTKKTYIEDEVLEKLGVNSRVKETLIYSNLSLNDIWRLANELTTPAHLVGNDNISQVMSVSPSGLFKTTKSRIKYNFSLTELVPREYTKYAYESYFSIDEENESYDNEAARKSTINWFGSRYFTNSEGEYQGIRTFSPSGNAEDWSYTYLNNFDSLRRQGWFQNGEGHNKYDNSPKFNATVLPNSVFDINKYRVVEKTKQKQERVQTIFGHTQTVTRTVEVPGELPEAKTKNRSVDFYKVFLETMGYGKTISQIFTKNELRNNDRGIENTNTSYPTLIKFSGYLAENTKATGLVLKDQTGKIYEQSLFETTKTFNFFGHKDIDEGAKMSEDGQNPSTNRQKQIQNRLYPADAGYSQNFVSYITKNFMDVKDNSTIHLWYDTNQDGKATDDELLTYNITLPTQRAVSTQRSTNVTTSNFEKFIIENNNNQATIRKLKP